jgi:hypothetical protein
VKSAARVLVVGALGIGLTGFAPVSTALASTEPVTGTSLLPAPTGLSPDDTGAPFPHQARKTVTLDWSPVSGATKYRVQVGRDSTWSDAPILTKDVVFSEWTLPQSLSYATYVWRVAAISGSTVGHWSSEQGLAHANASFTRGWRTAPTPTAVVSPYVGLPTFRWSPVADADAYELQVATVDFALGVSTGPTPDTSPTGTTQSQAPAGLVGECFTPRTRVTPSGDEVAKSGTAGECGFKLPNDGSTLYWRVRALDAFVSEETTGDTVPASSAGVASTTPKDPNLAEPCGENPEAFSCEPSRPSIAGSWSATSSFASTLATPTTTTSATVPTLSLGSDPDGLCDVVTDGTPTEAEHAVCTDVPTIRWPAITGATQYRVTVALDDALTNIQHVVYTTALQWTPPGSWPDASATTSYYYVVQACDASCGPVTTTPPSFSKVTPRLTLGANPGVTGEFRLSWNSYSAALAAASGQAATQDAYAYHLQVARSDHPSFDQLVDDEVVDETFFSPLKSYGDGQFVWRVQPLDSNGNKLPFSFSKKFSRDATAPKVIKVSPSSSVAVTQPLTVTFSESVLGVSASSLGLSPAVAHTVTFVTSTTWKITPTAPMVPGATYRVVLTSAIHDQAGNAAGGFGPSLTVSKSVADNSKAFGYAGSWSTRSASNAVGGSYHSALPTSTSHPYATTKFFGAGLYVYSCLGPANGYLDVYVDNVKKARVSLYRAYSGCGIRVATLSGLARSTHTLKLVGVGAHQSASKGNGVAVDHVTVV